jgi:hypothetical protein
LILGEFLKKENEKIERLETEAAVFTLTPEEQPKSVVYKFNSTILDCNNEPDDQTYKHILKEVKRIGGVVKETKEKCGIYLVSSIMGKLPIITMHKFHHNSGKASINALR